jgi:hypothetical protein
MRASSRVPSVRQRTRGDWPLVEIAAKLLPQDEREVVLGDLTEANESVWLALWDVLGLFLRRQALLWKEVKPWLAGFALTLPSTYLLLGASVSVSCTYQRLIYHRTFDAHAPTGHEGIILLLCHIALLIGWSWVAGFVVTVLSPRTLWLNAALLACVAVFCVATDCVIGLPRGYPFLSLLPTMMGVHHALRKMCVTLATALVLAVTITLLMISAWSNKALWVFNWVLIFPAWYLVVVAWSTRDQAGSSQPRITAIPSLNNRSHAH